MAGIKTSNITSSKLTPQEKCLSTSAELMITYSPQNSTR
jgi:hypothetical protein